MVALLVPSGSRCLSAAVWAWSCFRWPKWPLWLQPAVDNIVSSEDLSGIVRRLVADRLFQTGYRNSHLAICRSLFRLRLGGCVLLDGKQLCLRWRKQIIFTLTMSRVLTVILTTCRYIGAQQVLALISLCNRDFVIQGWHGALITMAIVCLAIFFNTAAIGKLPVLEGLAVVLHVFGFFAFIAIFWVM